MVENLFFESVALIRSLIRLFNLNFISYFRIGEIESVQKSVFTDKKDVVNKNVKFRKIKIVFLNNFIFKAEITKLLFYFINLIEGIWIDDCQSL
jgi:hypothetical protein